MSSQPITAGLITPTGTVAPRPQNPDNASVYIVNEGVAAFIAEYSAERYVIQPGQGILAPYGAMVTWCGDPFAFDIDMKRRNRVRERERMGTKYGVYEHDHLWDTNIPKLKCYDMTGAEFMTILADPDGDASTIATQTVNQASNTEARLEQMEVEMQFLRNQLALERQQGSQAQTEPSAPLTAPPTFEEKVSEVGITDPDQSADLIAAAQAAGLDPTDIAPGMVPQPVTPDAGPVATETFAPEVGQVLASIDQLPADSPATAPRDSRPTSTVPKS